MTILGDWKPSPLEISVAEVKEALDSGDPIRLLDAREEWETIAASLPGSERITEALVNELLESGDREARYIIMCHHGLRSLDAAVFFAERGFKNVKSMAGGIDAWAIEIDTEVRRY